MSRGLRVMTYNVHGCIGVDRRLDLGRVAQVIAACDPDVVALQELDVGRRRSRAVDQPQALAERLGMQLDFRAARDCDGGRYGNAVLSRHKVTLVRGACLPQLHRGHEPRALQWVRVDTPGRALNVLNTHLGLDGRERMLQVAAILSKDWIDDARELGATVLCGDFNARPRSAVYRRLTGSLRDADAARGVHPSPRGTFPSLLPLLRIDHVLVSPELRVRECRVVTSWLARVASDHLPVVATLERERSIKYAILAPGRNCEQLTATGAAGVLVDARDYYLALRRTLCRAERYVLIAGWQFDSRVPLVRGRDAEDVAGPTRLLELIEHLAAARPGLRFHLLAWDYNLVFALEREWMQRFKFDWRTSDQIQFVFDDKHAAGASHHQKLVVVDGAIAFAGGIDLCGSRWDDRRHAPDNPERVTLLGTRQKPYHDVMAFCTDRAAGALTRVFCERWQRATGMLLDLPDTTAELTPPFDSALPIDDGEVAISTTYGAHPPSGTDKREHIKQLFEDAIRAAERLIYIETQYFTSRAVHAALCARMQRRGPELEVVIVMPDGADTPKENFALGDAQRWVLSSLCSTAREHGHALRVLYSAAPDAAGELVSTFIHAKLLIVDDRLLSVGSANCTNRSMSLDSELNLSWESTGASGDERLARGIARLRASLLCEHAGIGYDPSLERTFGLVARLDALVGRSKLRLHDIPERPSSVDRDPLLEHAFDPEEALTELAWSDWLEPRRD